LTGVSTEGGQVLFPPKADARGQQKIRNPNIEIRNNLEIQIAQIQNKLNINEQLDLT
jgi:hypothetical protein